MPTLRVGLPDALPPECFQALPPGVEAVLLPATPAQADHWPLDVWVPPFSAHAAEKVVSHVSGVRLVQSLMAGVDWLLPIVPSGAVVCDGRGVHDIPVAEWVVTAVLAHLKRLPEYLRLQEHGDWRGQAALRLSGGQQKPGWMWELGGELAGQTVLIAGYGSIGEAVEARLRPFGVTVLRIARTARQGVATMAELPAMLAQAEVVVLLLPLTAETRGVFDAAMLARMREGALLVNAARGPIVDTAALLEALRKGSIAAALDVTDPEPLPAGHPLWSAPNCIITPHVAGGTSGFVPRAMRFLASQCERLTRGQPLLNVVSGDY